MQKLRSKRALLKGAVTRICTFVNSNGIDQPIEDWECRLERLEEIWVEYKDIVRVMIEKSDDEEGMHVEVEADWAEFEERMLCIKSKLRLYIAENSRVTAATSSTFESTRQDAAVTSILSSQTDILQNLARQVSRPNISFLPKLKIKAFGGELTEWKAFHDSFVSAVHNNTVYTACQKFQLLKSYLTEAAYELVGHIHETNENYSEAWSKLCFRYNKLGVIANTHITKFLNLATTTSQSSINLRKIYDGADEVLRGLRALGEEAEKRDIWLIHLLLSKLDPATTREWTKLHKSNIDFPTINEFLSFLDTTCFALESAVLTTTSPTRQRIVSVKAHQTTVTRSMLCVKCNDTHELPQCSAFSRLGVKERRDFVASKRICFNCLRVGHISANCRSKFSCRICRKRHHSFLHQDTTEASLQRQRDEQAVTVNFNALPEINTLLPTAVCEVTDCYGEQQQCRMLLDSGSEKTIISENCVQRLGLRRQHSRIPIHGLNNIATGVSHGWVSLHITSMVDGESFNVEALIMPTISSSVPVQRLDKAQYSSFLSLDLADPTFYIPSPIDILLGSEKFFEILKGEKINNKSPNLKAFSTTLGWIVGGDLTCRVNKRSVGVFFNNFDIDKALSQFWETEEIQCTLPYTEEEDKAEKSFLNTHTRTDDGKFIVELPFKSKSNNFGKSAELALKRLNATERRLAGNSKLKEQYTNFMAEYLALQHMERVPEAEIKKPSTECCYLPHHPVIKAESTTTRLRVVFDGSASMGNHSSLNEALLPGPSLLRELFSVILRFRRHRFIMSGDVEKMYRMILVHDYHRDFQRILWRNAPNQPVEHYRLKTVTYGTTCAPYLAVRVLIELARTSITAYPLASQVILKDFYMDDVMTGAETVAELFKIHNELIALLKTAGMNLRKWSSNCFELLQSLPENMREMSSMSFEPAKPLKLLGLKWNPTNDVFEFCVSPSTTARVTKQSILSDAARIFDPLGFLTPTTVLIKMLFQELWLVKLEWTDEVPAEIATRWINLRSTLELLNTLKIARRAIFKLGHNELHGFCDASQNAYAAVVYCRSDYHGSISTQLVASKSRVAPLKTVSLPRLELCGAVLLCRLMNEVIKAFEFGSTNIYMWTDSSIVLHWLSAVPRRWSVYVANRTSEILTSYTRSQWNHVRSADNPADPGSRGVLPLELKSLTIWWNGPSWLAKAKEFWPQTNSLLNIPQYNLEERKNKIQRITKLFLISTEHHVVLGSLLQHMSIWSRLVRAAAYCLRFIGSLRKLKFSSFMSSNELQDATNFIIRAVQEELFAAEISALKGHRAVASKSKLSSLTPFLDSAGVLRVGGRIGNSSATFSIKHPVILSAKHIVTGMIVKYMHLAHLHVGVNHLIFIIRQQYWILGARNIARRIVHDCITCFKLRKTKQHQLMADLPIERVRFQRAFSKVGCDYAGPFLLKVEIGKIPRRVKGYIALFVCFITKAIHLELVGDLTTQSYIGALDRFISRRGKPMEIWSDNATNFLGAKRSLDEIQYIVSKQNNSSDIADYFARNNISWHFIPPSSPHFGGLWESGVKSVKTHLKRVIGQTALTYERFYTLLTRIEAVLNSRPLCPSNDGEIDALTPAHFLIGHPFTARTEAPVDPAVNTSPLKQWHKVKHMAQGFWNRWHSEYLTSLQQRHKWRKDERNFKLGDIVILREANVPQSQWVLAKVIKLHPSADNKIRVVTVKTSKGEYMRPIHKLALLPISVGPESSSGGENEQ